MTVTDLTERVNARTGGHEQSQGRYRLAGGR